MDDEYIFYSDRLEWSDVKPLDVEQPEESVIKINYSETFRDCFGYLRAVLRSGELSERAFQLTTKCANENPSCYTVWLFRRKLLLHLRKPLAEEIDFMTSQIRDNPKNYQVWYHRQKVIEWKKDGIFPSAPGELEEDIEFELDFVSSMLEEDAKNYHAWQYRQWLLRTFSLWEKELEFCELMIDSDFRNNSVWNQRFYVILNTTGFTEAVLEREVQFTIEYIRKAILNESAWNYLRGILAHATKPQKQKLLSFLEAFRHEAREENIFLFSLMLDMYESDGQIEKAKEVASVLKKNDKLRENYWDFRERSLIVE